MKKKSLYALFLCFILNGMSPAHAQTTSFLRTIKGYITSIKEYASGIYKHITSTNMLIGGATLAASALVVNYFYTSKGSNKSQQQTPNNNESSTTRMTNTSAQPQITPVNPQPIEQKLIELKRLLQTNKITLPADTSSLCRETEEIVDRFTKCDITAHRYQNNTTQQNDDYKRIFALFYDCAQLARVSIPIEKFVIYHLHVGNTNLASWTIENYPLTKDAIDTRIESGEWPGIRCKIVHSMLHALIANQLNTAAKKIIACNADLELRANTLHNTIGLTLMNNENEFYQTPFIFAVAYNNLEMVKLLLYIKNPTTKELQDALRIAHTMQQNNTPLDTTIIELLNNPNTIATHITTDEKKEFDTIERQRRGILSEELFKGPHVLNNGKKSYGCDTLIQCQN